MAELDWLGRTLVISTPESIDFTYERAGFGTRFLAWLIDAVVISLLTVALLTTSVFARTGWAALFFTTILFVLWVGYFIILEVFMHGQTVGKRIAGIRVLDSRGFRVTPGQSVVRNLFRFVDSLPFFYLVGGTAALLNRNGLRLGDMAAGTVVVKIPLPAAPSLLVASDRNDALLADPLLGDRVRRMLRAPEKDLLAALAVRRDRLEERARMEVFSAAAAHFAERLQIPKPETMSAETYIVNLAAIAHAPRERLQTTRR